MNDIIITQMDNIELLPPYLPALGVKRVTPDPEADIITIMNKVPYPVLGRYKQWCRKIGIEPFACGTYNNQGEPDTGYINSGYRDGDKDIGARYSAHKFGLAIDPIVYTVDDQINFAPNAASLFMRVGLYPEEKIMHFDLCPIIWIKKYSNLNKRYWVKLNGKYHYFRNITDTMNFADLKGKK